ncbi:MAG: FAD-dependent oxidoreductase [Rhodospirillaceae bacterium]|jgi:NADPH-dependent glutamate synthase beta subunit-like oxidoreductase/NAD(P)H-flavin reductase|nr:FAD-dependent oxidoreductase [Rhodospirillaceae bacterium]MBT5244070.1 FAD-dependent oxidoreductase [Rhodospirillaceae bacterium]MBT5560890.1 FAD-dependent oxidoreductase [Rhodospirillaceae bacterium]MBT6241179.1 FAD-dependent oxidoreductase [Rhodospirillaceae bacterium]MBT7136536.1 FAD-dependent oxidoreductase [Rhodospirillaceae bacterium]
MTDLTLAHHLSFKDLYDNDGLIRLDKAFLEHMQEADGDLSRRLIDARKDPDALDEKATSDLILDLGPHVDDFIGHLFGIERQIRELAERHHDLAPLFACKRLFVQRQAAKKIKPDEAGTIDGSGLEQQLTAQMGDAFDQLTFAKTVMNWLDDEETNADALDMARRYAAWAFHTQAGKQRHRADVLFKGPEKVDFMNLVEAETFHDHGTDILHLPPESQHPRDGFALTDQGCDLVGALDQANYCVICHDRGKDTCSRGIRDKQSGAFASNELNIPQAGCPLEEKISEMHKAKADGHAVAALAIIAIDNPMTAATGHRICNDCMKACIYQKQEPVNIPEAETRTLKDVLELPWGFEIYSLLTRWNPLNFKRPHPASDSGYKVLVVGQGPAGFTLAHYLMNEGHTVVAIDGAKIEPLDASLSGISQSGERTAFEPIHSFTDIEEPLDERTMAGFGGVAEYGITVRWNKNFLKAIRIMLERRAHYTLYGGVRFGGAITADNAFEMGFDHIALCIGAGKPTVLGIPNALARGVRQASDFLMALQLTGAAKSDSVANLNIRLPVVVIGGGLTAIDTATEALAYYVKQVEKFLVRHEKLAANGGVDADWSKEEQGFAEEFLQHGKAIRDERQAAAKEDRLPNFAPLLDSWGGATIAYRRRLIDAPSYTLNHEEITKAFEQGINFAEMVSPVAIDVDDHGHAQAIKLEVQELDEHNRPNATGHVISLPARSILIAAGTQPNTVIAREYPGFADLDGKYFQAEDEDGNIVSPEWSAKPEEAQVTMKVTENGHSITFFGDLHPSFAGNVVKAMASARRGYPVINRQLVKNPPSPVSASNLVEQLDHGLRARVVDVIRLTPNIVEVVLHAPLAARAFKPGQFFRLQNFEANAKRCDGTVLGMEGQALTGAWVDVEKGLVATIVLEMGGSSSLCELLQPGEHVILMGPTGAPTETPGGETVVLVGGGLGNAVLFSIGQAFRQAGSKVLYFAAYKGTGDRYHIDNIEAAADTIVWCCDEAPGFEPGRDGDKAFVGNVVEAMTAYANGGLGDNPISMKDAERMLVIGSDVMMKAVADARHGILKEHLDPAHTAIGSINSPMQCMMKEICAQCLQLHRDPETGEETIIFSCFNQDQNLDHVVFPALKQRLLQNAVQEKLTRQWIMHCMSDLQDAG